VRDEGAYKELLAPLATSRSGIIMLLAGDLGQLTNGQRSYLKSILQLNEYMISCITNWVDVDRIVRGKLMLHREPVNVGSLLDHSLRSQRTTPWPMVYADATRLKQMVDYCTEAIAATEIRARVVGDECIITFHNPKNHDTDLRADIVRAFHLTKATKQLGLRITWLLARSHGGNLTLNPHTAQGMRLHLAMPLAQQMSLLGE
jgi:K+-sensing histidine kinase KdpD